MENLVFSLPLKKSKLFLIFFLISCSSLHSSSFQAPKAHAMKTASSWPNCPFPTITHSRPQKWSSRRTCFIRISILTAGFAYLSYTLPEKTPWVTRRLPRGERKGWGKLIRLGPKNEMFLHIYTIPSLSLSSLSFFLLLPSSTSSPLQPFSHHLFLLHLDQMESCSKCREDPLVGGLDAGGAEWRICGQCWRLQNVARRQIQIWVHCQQNCAEEPRTVIMEREEEEMMIVREILNGFLRKGKQQEGNKHPWRNE